MKRKLIFYFVTLLTSLVIVSCGDSTLRHTVTVDLNPNGIAPLTAILAVSTNMPSRASVTVLGPQPVSQSYDLLADNLQVPVVGLYPGTTNKVILTLTSQDLVVTDTIEITTDHLPAYIPRIEINKIDRQRMEPGMHLCDIHYAKQGKYDSRPLVFDDNGIVRWYLDISFVGDVMWPLPQLQNGNFMMAGLNMIYEYNMLGKEIKKSIIDEKYRIHHDIVELPDGNLLLPVRKEGAQIMIDGKAETSLNDFMILYDRAQEKIVREWDLAKHMDVSRSDLNGNAPGDWLHMNGLAYEARDSSIIVSCRKQGVVKLSWDDELIWIMAPKKNWGKSGREGTGFETAPYLLTAVDSSGYAYPQGVQTGDVSRADFDFAWGQHAPELLPNGNLILFDNGYLRNYNLEGNYSRAVEYRIDDANRTVQQIWQYGKERGGQFFSLLISDVDYLPKTGNILVTPGFINQYGKIVEVTYPEGDEVFEATVAFNTLNGNKTFAWGQLDILYRSERFELKF